MTEALKVFFLIFFLSLAFGLWMKESGKRVVVSPFLFCLFLILVVGSGGFFVNRDDARINHLMLLLIWFLVYSSFLVGFFLAAYRKAAGKNHVYRFALEKKQWAPAVRDNIHIYYILTAMIFLVGFLFFQGLPPTVGALGSLLLGSGGFDSAGLVSDGRFLLTKGAYFGEEYKGQGIFNAILHLLCSLHITYAALNIAVSYSRRAVVLLVLSVILAWLFVGGVGDRAPFLEIIIVASCAYSIANPVRIKYVLIVAIVLFVLAMLSSVYSNKAASLIHSSNGDVIEIMAASIFDRLTLGNSMNDVRVIELVETGEWELRGGAANFRNIVTAIPGVNYGVPVAYELFQYYNPASNATTFLSGTYLMNFYVDFGFLGSIIAYLSIGAFVGAAQRYMFLKRSYSLVYVVFLPTLFYTVAKTLLVGPPGLLAKVVLMVPIYLLLKFTLKGKKVRRFGA